MNNHINIPEPTDNKKRIVIVGGGFAGLQMAKLVDTRFYQVVLIDKNNFHQFQPLFYQVATGGLEPSSISYPYRKIFHESKEVYFRMCTALSVDVDEKLLSTTIGSIAYDELVIATGCNTNYFGNEALVDHTFALKSTAESLLLRNRILLSLEQATNAVDETELKEILTFVIVGGGATGVELAGALAEMRSSILPKDYPDIDFSKMEIHLINSGTRILSSMSEYASEKAARALLKRNVILDLDKAVSGYESPVVKMKDGFEIRSRNVFWVAGVKPNALPGIPESSLDRGRILVDQFNCVTNLEHIFSIGDTSAMLSDELPKGHPQVAQVAIQMARNVALNFNRQAKHLPMRPFCYKDKGSLATIGRNAAVADLGKLRLSGFLAWWLWLIVHIMSLIGMKNRISVLLDWIWNYLNYDASLRIFIRPKFNRIYEE